MTSPLSEFGGSPSGSFKVEEEVGEPDVGPLSPTSPSSTPSLSLNAEDPLKSGCRIHHMVSRRMSAPNPCKVASADSMPSVPRRRGSHSSDFSISERKTRSLEFFIDEEDDTIHEFNHKEDDDLSSKPPMERTVSRRLSDSERRFAANADTIAPPVRVGSVASGTSGDASKYQDEADSQPQSSTEVTDEAIESMILSQIPKHIRNQMTPDMWKQIFTVNTINRHSGAAASVCSELTDDLRSIKSRLTPSTKRRSIDHTGMIEDIDPPGEKDFVNENLESHSTFRTEDSKDFVSVEVPSSKRSTSSTKDEDTHASAASSIVSPVSKKSPTLPKPTKSSTSTRSVRRSHRTSRHQNGAKGDAPPQVPKKVRSIRSSRSGDGSVSSDQTPGRRVPKKIKRSVRFRTEADVRNYERVLDIHPSTSSGPSVGIGWAFVESTAKITTGPSPDKRYGDMLLSRQQRERIVRVELGYSPKQIAKAIRKNLKIKNQRRRTVNNLQEYGSFAPVEKVEYLLEKCQKKLGRLSFGRKTSSSRTI
ncbi:MAG: hypothetical protein SGBAC_002947 [Bacillariaceae sp.]